MAAAVWRARCNGLVITLVDGTDLGPEPLGLGPTDGIEVDVESAEQQPASVRLGPPVPNDQQLHGTTSRDR